MTLTYYFLVSHAAAGVSCCQGRGALLGIPGRLTLLGGAADRDGVDGGGVTITVTVVSLAASIT